jgi:hypothetical protein
MGTGGRPGVTVEGGPQLRRAFGKAADRAEDMKLLHKGAAEIVGQRAEEIVPRLIGQLADTIRTTARKTGSSVVAGGRRAVYAGPIHFGWRARNIEPQPFLYTALDERRGEVHQRYIEGVEDLVRAFDREAPK